MAARVQSHAARDTRVTYIHVAHKLTYSHPYAPTLTNVLGVTYLLTNLRTYELTRRQGRRRRVCRAARSRARGTRHRLVCDQAGGGGGGGGGRTPGGGA